MNILLQEGPTLLDLPVKGLPEQTAAVLRGSAWTISELIAGV
jgi:hypothetical protein